MKQTMGIFLLNSDNLILLGHPTNSPRNSWTIPKGRPEENEVPIYTAIREFKEETSIDLTEHMANLLFLGTEDYLNKKKQLLGFLIKIYIEFPNPVCTSLVEGETFPEIDIFIWSTYEEALRLVHHSQKQLMIKNRPLFHMQKIRRKYEKDA